MGRDVQYLFCPHRRLLAGRARHREAPSLYVKGFCDRHAKTDAILHHWLLRES